MNKKNKLFGLLAGIGCVALTAGFGLQVTATAEEKKLGDVDVSSFRMAYGAGVRFNPNDTEDKTGIRFIANLSDEAYTKLQNLDGDVTYGMVIVPADIVKAKPLTLENLFGTNAVYCFEDPKEKGEEEGCTCAKQHIASVQYTTLAEGEKNDGLKDLRGSLVDIKEDNFTREFIGMAYMEYNGAYVLAENAYGENANGESDGIADVKNNTRSMAYVAQLAIEDNQDDSKNTLYNTYLKELAETYEFAYTVNHYLPDENGDYGEPVIEKAWGTLNEEVEAKHITSSTVDNKENYVGYRIYAFGKNSNTKDIVYANGKTVLNCYYEKIDTTLLDCSTDELVENSTYTYLEYANLNVGDVKNEKYKVETANMATCEEGGEKREGVTMIKFSGENNAYFSGKLALALPNDKVKQANEVDWSYLKISMLLKVDNGDTTATIGSYNQTNFTTIQTGVWQEVIITKSQLNQYGAYLWWNNPAATTKADFDYKFANTYFKNSVAMFLCVSSVKTSTVDTANGETDTVTYYIDKIEYGVDTVAPEITVTGLGSEMYEGIFTEPTVTVADDYTLARARIANAEYREIFVSKKLYKVEGETRTEIALTDGTADLTKGSYVYVVTANDAIFNDVTGNSATEEVEFEVVERQDVVITFNDASDVTYAQKDTSKTYYAETSYLTEEQLAAEGLNSGDIAPVGGAIKFVAGMEGSTDAKGTGGSAMYGAWLKFMLSDNELALISDATAVTIRMYVKTSHPNPNFSNDTHPELDIEFFEGGNNKTPYTGCDRGEWVDLTITAEQLSKNFVNYFNGNTALFWTSTFTMYNKSAVATYYINSITFDVTP